MIFNFGKKKKPTKEQLEETFGKSLEDLAKENGTEYALAKGTSRMVKEMYFVFDLLYHKPLEFEKLSSPYWEKLNQVADDFSNFEKERRKIWIPLHCMQAVLALEEFLIFANTNGYPLTAKETLDMWFANMDIGEQYHLYLKSFPENKTKEDLTAFVYSEIMLIEEIAYPRITAPNPEIMSEDFPLYIQDFYKRHKLDPTELDEFAKKYGARVSV